MTLISFMLLILTVTHQFSLFILWGSCWALGFVFSCPRGQNTLVSFSLLLCMSKLTCQISCDSMMDLKNCQKSLLLQQHVMKSKSRIICIKYITHVTSITACRYNLSQNRLKFNRFYIM